MKAIKLAPKGAFIDCGMLSAHKYGMALKELNSQTCKHALFFIITGFLYINPTDASIEVYKHMAYMAFHMKWDDQYQLNYALKAVSENYSDKPISAV